MKLFSWISGSKPVPDGFDISKSGVTSTGMTFNVTKKGLIVANFASAHPFLLSDRTAIPPCGQDRIQSTRITSSYIRDKSSPRKFKSDIFWPTIPEGTLNEIRSGFNAIDVVLVNMEVSRALSWAIQYYNDEQLRQVYESKMFCAKMLTSKERDKYGFPKNSLICHATRFQQLKI